ncbi:MAG: S-methyl-5'-thioadenosine phosphorylase [Phycisphaerae bacterium]
MADNVLGIIGGTGIGETFVKRSGAERIEIDTPFGRPSDAILRVNVDGLACLFVSRHGEGHRLSPSQVPYRANIYALKTLGATHVIATGATGSLREEIGPGDLVVCDQVIDKTFGRPSTFFDDGIAAHVEFAEPFCQTMRKALLAAASSIEAKVHDGGAYVCMEGPQFSTRAESQLHRNWGGDLIGMTCMPEAKLAREAEMCYALIALPTDYDSWRPRQADEDKTALLAEIIANMRRAGAAALALIERTIGQLADSDLPPCACHDALELAIWTDRKYVQPAIVEKLKPLIGRYFPDGA